MRLEIGGWGMKRVRVRILGPGFHPNELLVAVLTEDGSEEKLVVDWRSIADESISIEYPVDYSENSYLVELPRESFRGTWRVWVPRTSLTEESVA